MKKIVDLKQVQALIGETYMYAVIVAVAAVVLANLIKYQGGKNSTDHILRRVWYIIIGIAAPIGFFLYNALYVSSYIAKAPLQAKFSTANILVLLGVYVVLGIITMLIMRRSKWGSILGKSKK